MTDYVQTFIFHNDNGLKRFDHHNGSLDRLLLAFVVASAPLQVVFKNNRHDCANTQSNSLLLHTSCVTLKANCSFAHIIFEIPHLSPNTRKGCKYVSINCPIKRLRNRNMFPASPLSKIEPIQQLLIAFGKSTRFGQSRFSARLQRRNPTSIYNLPMSSCDW